MSPRYLLLFDISIINQYFMQHHWIKFVRGCISTSNSSEFWNVRSHLPRTFVGNDFHTLFARVDGSVLQGSQLSQEDG